MMVAVFFQLRHFSATRELSNGRSVDFSRNFCRATAGVVAIILATLTRAMPINLLTPSIDQTELCIFIRTYAHLFISSLFSAASHLIEKECGA